MSLPTLWFAVIAFFWTGYLFLEGFDFGVGMLLPVLGRTEADRRLLLATIGPVWDANEVWLVVAVGAMFAAFPGWYASLLSGSYLALVAALVALILRAVAFEFRGKVEDLRWRRWWDRAIVFGSVLPPFVWGLMLSGPIAGVVLVVLCAVHGALFLSLKTTGLLPLRHSRLAFAAGGAAILLWTAVVLAPMYPQTVGQAASPYALAVLTVVTLFFIPLVLLYQGWTYWVFRRRLRRQDVEIAIPPARAA